MREMLRRTALMDDAPGANARTIGGRRACPACLITAFAGSVAPAAMKRTERRSSYLCCRRTPVFHHVDNGNAERMRERPDGVRRCLQDARNAKLTIEASLPKTAQPAQPAA
jgi:hypothetical protein